MALPTQKSQATRVGQARPSQLMLANGIGAIADLPQISVVLLGLDFWPQEHTSVVDEPRLLAEVRRVVGPQVATLRHPPQDSNPDDPWSGVGVPVASFPRWVRCRACGRLGSLDSSDFALVHKFARRPDLAHYAHVHCPKQTQRKNKVPCIPARFVVVCEAGHLDDFPYVEYVHQGATGRCDGPMLTLSDSANTLSPQVTITCRNCDAKRNIAQASGPRGSDNLPRCRGRHPHLQRFHGCGAPVRLMVLGATSLWFSQNLSALHLPTSGGLAELVQTNWPILQTITDQVMLHTFISNVPALQALLAYPLEDVYAELEKLRSGEERPSTDEGLLDAEWNLLCHPTTEKSDDDFRAVPRVGVPAGYDRLLRQTVAVHRLREVQALVGFTRISAPDPADASRRIPLARDERWVPAAEQRGEGIFLEFHEDAVASWVRRVDDHPRIEALRQAYTAWRRNRELPPDTSFPISRYLLLHTFSHMLIRQVCLECGYSAASIRERLYVGTAKQPQAGLLLSTAASDSEGTLGGLVSLSETHILTRLLDQALDDAGRCSSDPFCAEHAPQPISETLHGAACHACLFASETSCESNNRWLDRTVLVDLDKDGLAFPLRS